jgi:hypothetical protein
LVDHCVSNPLLPPGLVETLRTDNLRTERLEAGHEHGQQPPGIVVVFPEDQDRACMLLGNQELRSLPTFQLIGREDAQEVAGAATQVRRGRGRREEHPTEAVGNRNHGLGLGRGRASDDQCRPLLEDCLAGAGGSRGIGARVAVQHLDGLALDRSELGKGQADAALDRRPIDGGRPGFRQHDTDPWRLATGKTPQAHR